MLKYYFLQSFICEMQEIWDNLKGYDNFSKDKAITVYQLVLYSGEQSASVQQIEEVYRIIYPQGTGKASIQSHTPNETSFDSYVNVLNRITAEMFGQYDESGNPYVTEQQAESNRTGAFLVFGEAVGGAVSSVAKGTVSVVKRVGNYVGDGVGSIWSKLWRASKAGTLSNLEVRQWYIQQEARIPELIGQSASLEQQAMQASQLRNKFRTQARGLMADRNEAARLLREEPNMTWAEVVKKYQARGYQGDDLWNAIIKGSQRSRPSVNQSLGL